MFYNIFVIMSQALLSDSQVDLIRSVIAKDKKQQLARTRESYRKLKKERVNDILNNPSSICDQKVKQNHRQAVKHILYESFEDSIVTASYDKKIIGLCEQQRKINDVEVRWSLGMLYRQDEMEEKLNDQERIRSEQKIKQMRESRKSSGLMQDSKKEEMLMSPSHAKQMIVLKNEESYHQSSAESVEKNHSNRDESQSWDRVHQKSSSHLGRDSVHVEPSEPINQQDASFSNSIMNSPAFFLPHNHSQPRLLENSSKQEKQFSNPQLLPPAIESLQQNQILQEDKTYIPEPMIQEIIESSQGSREVKTQLPEPKIEEIFENLLLKTKTVPQSVLPESIIDYIQLQERVAFSPAIACETERVGQVVKVEEQIVEENPRDCAVGSIAFKQKNAEQRQPQYNECESFSSLAIQPEIKAARVEAKQTPLNQGEQIIENVRIGKPLDLPINFIYKVALESTQVVSAHIQTGIQEQKDDYDLIE